MSGFDLPSLSGLGQSPWAGIGGGGLRGLESGSTAGLDPQQLTQGLELPQLPVRPGGDERRLDALGPIESPFAGTLSAALSRVQALDDDVAAKTRDIAMGRNVELHELMTSMGKSEVAFNLMIEVRNKLVDAWEKLSRSAV